MANDLASWLRESQVVSMCLKLATPRTSRGLNKTPCIKVRKMKRSSLHRTYRTFNDTVRRYHQCQWNIYTAKRAQNWCPNFCLTQSPLTSLLSLQMLIQRRNRTKTTKAKNHLFVFFIFFFFFLTISTLSTWAHQHPQVLAQSSCVVIDCDTVTCSTSSFRLWTGTADGAQCTSPKHIIWTSKLHPNKEKAWQISFVHCGHTGAQSMNDRSVDGRYERMHL